MGRKRTHNWTSKTKRKHFEKENHLKHVDVIVYYFFVFFIYFYFKKNLKIEFAMNAFIIFIFSFNLFVFPFY